MVTPDTRRAGIDAFIRAIYHHDTENASTADPWEVLLQAVVWTDRGLEARPVEAEPC